MSATTRPVKATRTWEQYCAEIGVDAEAARKSSVVRALYALISGRGTCELCGAEPVSRGHMVCDTCGERTAGF